MVVYCLDCGQPYDRADEESWRVRCRRCYFNYKHERQEVRAHAPAVDDLRRELLDNMRPLLQLAHPDKHNGSDTANRVTQWLLSLRDRIGASRDR